MCAGLSWMNPKEGEHLEGLGVDGSKGKGKAFPLQAWPGPWDSMSLRLQNF